MMKKSLLCMMTVLATALLSAANAVAQEYTLREIYQKALNTSEKMEIARENVYVAQMSKDKALSLLIPRLTAYGTYNRFTEDKYNTANIMIQPEDSAAWGGARRSDFLVERPRAGCFKNSGPVHFQERI